MTTAEAFDNLRQALKEFRMAFAESLPAWIKKPFRKIEGD